MISKFLYFTLYSVYDTRNTLLDTLKAHPIAPATTKWVMCYKIILDYLKKNRMHLVIKAIDIELSEYDVTSKEIAAHHTKKYRKLMPEGGSKYLEQISRQFTINTTDESINVDSLVDSKPIPMPDRNYYPLYDPRIG